MVGDAGGVFFSGGESAVGERALKSAERRAVDMVDDDGNARPFRGDASEYSRLAAVSVKDRKSVV